MSFKYTGDRVIVDVNGVVNRESRVGKEKIAMTKPWDSSIIKKIRRTRQRDFKTQNTCQRGRGKRRGRGKAGREAVRLGTLRGESSFYVGRGRLCAGMID